MTERYPAVPTAPPPADAPAWDIPGVAAALGTLPNARTDVILGQGVVFRLGGAPPVDLELYEQARTVRMTGGEMQIALSDQDGPTVAPEGVVFARHSAPHRRVFSVAPSGEVGLFLAPPIRTRQEPPNAADRAIVLPSPAAAVRSDPAAPEGVSQAGLPEAETDRERVRFGGRLGSDPRFRETRNGVLVGSFPVAVSHEDGSTTWERVVAFRESAAKLQGEGGPKKGHYVEVIGYRHDRDKRGRDGRVRRVEEIYVVVIKPR